MKLLVAPNSFKGTLTPSQAALAIKKGVEQKDGNIKCLLRPVSDGGDGLIEIISNLWRGKIINITVEGPLKKRVGARYFFSSGGIAVIEMAEASGIKYLKDKELDCMNASTFGTGQIIRDALRRGAKEIIIGLGGSASNDGGVGCAQGFGFKFTDKNGKDIPRGAAGLFSLEKIKTRKVDLKIIALADVENRLCGPKGSARVFGPQKGATTAEVLKLEEALLHLARTVKKDLNKNIKRVKGGAAAGGLGAGLYAFFNAQIVNGAEFIFKISGMRQMVKMCDLIVTGEGKFDYQSVEGKTFSQMRKLATEFGKKIIVICGKNEVKKNDFKKNKILSVIEMRKIFRGENIFDNPSKRLSAAALRIRENSSIRKSRFS